MGETSVKSVTVDTDLVLSLKLHFSLCSENGESCPIPLWFGNLTLHFQQQSSQEKIPKITWLLLFTRKTSLPLSLPGNDDDHKWASCCRNQQWEVQIRSSTLNIKMLVFVCVCVCEREYGSKVKEGRGRGTNSSPQRRESRVEGKRPELLNSHCARWLH